MDTKRSWLITFIDPVVMQVLQDLYRTMEVDKKPYDELLELLKMHKKPQQSVNPQQKSNQKGNKCQEKSTRIYAVQLWHLAAACSF
jgi:hypothetical protein